MFWLITYSQFTGMQHKTANTVSTMQPAHWLADAIKRHPDADTVLIGSIEISKQQYVELKDIT